VTQQPTATSDPRATDPRATDPPATDSRPTDPPATDTPGTTAEPAASSAAGTAPSTMGDPPLDTRALRDAQSAPPPPQSAPPPGSGPAPTDARPAIRAQVAKAPTDVDAPLFSDEAAAGLRDRWIKIQTEFVDSPREAVEKADALVAETLKQLTETFAKERDELEAGWSTRDAATPGDDPRQSAVAEPSTEELRQAIRRYRSFFNRLLSV